MTEFTHLCKVLIGLEAPRTQVTEPELRMLRKYARGSQVIVEIGCFEGRTACALAASTAGRVFTIDAFRPGRMGFSSSECIARWIRLKDGLRPNLTIIRGSSADVGAGFGLPIDLLFIDADHSYDGIRRDWETWAPKVRPAGVIALHDCRPTPNHPHYYGSARFYEDDLRGDPDVDEIERVESLVLFRKRTSVPPLSRVELRVNRAGKAA